MADFNQNTPRPSTEGPRMSANRGELYAQITAEDEEVVTVAPKKQSHIISLMAVLMKITFHVDAFRRSNERLFIFLHSIWSLFMGILYTCGLITLLITVFSFTQLPIHLENFLKERGIQYDSLEMSDYSFSQINIKNLKDIEGNYHIPNITVHSTFTDFLQNRIRMVEASGLRINLKNGISKNTQDLKLILNLLKIFSSQKQDGLNLGINMVHINNAVLNISNNQKNIPVAFSLSGTYSNENQIIIPFSINEDFLKITNATLQITGTEEERIIKIETGKTGELTLPQRPTEKLEGNIEIQMQGDVVQKIQIEAFLNHASSLKTIRVNLTNNGENNFDGNLLFTIGTSVDKQTSTDLTTDLSINFKDLTLTEDGKIVTQKPLIINIKRFVYYPTVIEGLEANLNGQLSCILKDFKCDYHLQKETDIKMKNLTFNVKNEVVNFSQFPSFKITGINKKIMSLQLKSPYFQFNSPLGKVQLTGYVGTNKENLLLEAEKMNLIFILGQSTIDNHLQLSINNGNYQTTDISLNPFELYIQDYFNPTGKIQLTSNKVTTSSPLLSKPIELNVLNIGEQTSIQGKILDTPISFDATGYFNPFTTQFVGKFIIPAFNLEQIPFQLSDLSTIFSPQISQLSGQFIAYGNLNIQGLNNVGGPFSIGLKDVGFKLNDTTLSGINGVLGLNSLSPLVTTNNQKLFIQNIQNLIPVSNLLIQFQINNQSVRLSNLFGQIAGQNVMMSSYLIPLKTPNETLSLRTAGTFDMVDLNPYFDLGEIYLKDGKGSFNIPIYISYNGINWGNLTFKMTNSTLEKTGENNILNLFDGNVSGYTVRSGQLIFNHQNELNVSLDGWLLPDNIKTSFGPETIQLTEPVFKNTPQTNVPQDIKILQNQLFEIGKPE